MKFTLILQIVFLLLIARPVFPDQIKVINQVLFEINKEAITTYDFKNYLKLKQDLKSENLLSLVKNELQEFILYKLCLREIESLDLNISESDKAKTKNPDERQFLQVQSYLKLKEKHITQIARYNSWTDILKRKYNYIAKIDELK